MEDNHQNNLGQPFSGPKVFFKEVSFPPDWELFKAKVMSVLYQNRKKLKVFSSDRVVLLIVQRGYTSPRRLRKTENPMTFFLTHI